MRIIEPVSATLPRTWAAWVVITIVSFGSLFIFIGLL